MKKLNPNIETDLSQTDKFQAQNETKNQNSFWSAIKTEPVKQVSSLIAPCGIEGCDGTGHILGLKHKHHFTYVET